MARRAFRSGARSRTAAARGLGVALGRDRGAELLHQVAQQLLEVGIAQKPRQPVGPLAAEKTGQGARASSSDVFIAMRLAEPPASEVSNLALASARRQEIHERVRRRDPKAIARDVGAHRLEEGLVS